MVNSVSSNIGVNFTQAGSTRHVVSSEQKIAIEALLENYDASSLTSADAKEITDSFKDMGIRPSRELRETIEASGFDADEIRELSFSSNIQGSQPPPPPKKDNSEELSIYEELLAELLEANTNQENKSASEKVDEFTSRFSNLTDNAKDEVKGLFSQFQMGSETSKLNTPNSITNALNNILSNTTNYNRISVYA